MKMKQHTTKQSLLKCFQSEQVKPLPNHDLCVGNTDTINDVTSRSPENNGKHSAFICK